MTIHVVARGIVHEHPATIGSDRGDVTAFILGARRELSSRSQHVELDDLATCEVLCIGALAASALELKQGEQIVVTGQLRIFSTVSVLDEDTGGWMLARLEIHAEELSRIRTRGQGSETPEKTATPVELKSREGDHHGHHEDPQ